MGYRRHGHGLSDVGRRRVANEDAMFVDDASGLYIVADGMGGHAAGEIASHEAIDTIRGMVSRGQEAIAEVDVPSPPEAAIRRVVRLLESAVQAATYMVYGMAQHDPEQQGMGTTISALLLAGRVAVTAQVGDSRIYLVRDGQALQLTEDHTLVAWQIKQGIITEEEARFSPHRNVITRAVGSREYVQVDTHVFEVAPGDSFLVCSDGLHGYLTDAEIGPVTDLGPAVAARRFVELANERGGRDNITAVVVEVGPPE
ncbi:MAG TPA: protein phosphatase 2C domain-containing protein [Polyangiaceae bacterium LLY-WYZ-14_1]|nr:protein phosphatase 2C domain-containing protein [Polyangiaceae bacterium LLY-WYZ-14_1]